MAACFICAEPIEPSREDWAPTCEACMAQGCPLDPAGEERCDTCDCKRPETPSEE